MSSLQQSITEFAYELEKYLDGCLSTDSGIASDTVIKAMRYSLLGGGKRVRPFLLASFCRSCGGNVRQAMPFAAALEMIHTYSLIHDDLPCMDNDDFRRGKPTCHKAFGEAAAVLAGDGLLNLAAETLFVKGREAGAHDSVILDAAKTLFRASGVNGMIGGQMADMESSPRTHAALSEMDRMKTGALIKAAAQVGCIVGGGNPDMLKEAGDFAEALGLAFQIVDDLLDVDENKGEEPMKATYVRLLGMEEATKEAERLTVSAKESLKSFDDKMFYFELADYLLGREY